LELEIIYQDADIVAINKPHGLLVHRSKYADEAKVFAVQELRNQLNQYVYPCHRIDRKTSGVLLFALNEKVNSLMQQQFAENQVKKKYLALVRGFTPDQETIDYPLVNEKGKSQEALSHYKTIERFEIPVPFGKFETSRYSLIEVQPQTGRLHQIRKHMAHVLHPIIGDRPHGCNKQNRLFKERWQITTMMLHAAEITFSHPVNGKQIEVKAKPSTEFERMLFMLNTNK
jgi:tRNA pseudouridine65 synthase